MTKRTKNQQPLRYGSLNTRGYQTKTSQIADDMKHYKLDMLALQETHHKTSEAQNITTTDGNTHYTIYHSGNDQEPRAGVAIITNQSAQVSFLAVSARLCMCTIELKHPKQ